MKVKKRDGRVQEFNSEKITNAVQGAMNDIKVVDPDFAALIAEKVTKKVKKEIIEIEELQDLVEKELMNSSRKDVAKQYIKYRYDRERIRLNGTKMMKDVKKKLAATNVENQNANLDERSFSGRMNEANRVVMKDDALNNVMSKMARNNHLNNEIYIHKQNCGLY